MKNKVLVRLIVPEIDCDFDLFIPINELIWKVKKLVVKSVSDLTGESLDLEKEYILLNKMTNTIYSNNDIVVNTDIRNATELVLITEKNGS
ncbi:MAG: hypothetical protein VZS44_00185 [Bacilli bacterium]|nr:hypothetical protein [Bacilli bacterium]